MTLIKYRHGPGTNAHVRSLGCSHAGNTLMSELGLLWTIFDRWVGGEVMGRRVRSKGGREKGEKERERREG